MDSRPASDLFERLFASLPGLYLALAPDLQDRSRDRARTSRRRRLAARGSSGGTYFDVFPADPGEIDAWSSGLRASFETVRTDRVVDVIPVEPHHVRVPAEGASAQLVRYWSTVNSPLLDREGHLLAIVHRVQDVTELVQLTDGGDGPTLLRAIPAPASSRWKSGSCGALNNSGCRERAPEGRRRGRATRSTLPRIGRREHPECGLRQRYRAPFRPSEQTPTKS